MKAIQQSFSFYACYWHVKIFCQGSVRLLVACLLSHLEKLQGKNACLLVFYYVNCLPFDQCFPSLWTLLVFCETKKIHQILKTKTKREQEFPPVWMIWAVLSGCWSLLLKATHCSVLLQTVTEAVSMKTVPLKCTCPFSQADFSRVGKREWDLCTNSLEELVHLQSRHGTGESIRSFRQSILHSNKFLYGMKRLACVVPMPVHTDSLYLTEGSWVSYWWPNRPEPFVESAEGDGLNHPLEM